MIPSVSVASRGPLRQLSRDFPDDSKTCSNNGEFWIPRDERRCAQDHRYACAALLSGRSCGGG
jgi:hypothetical protein